MNAALENAIRHVRISAEIEKFGDAEQAVVARLLISDEATINNVLSELKEIRIMAGSDALALCARLTEAESHLQASRLVKATLVKRLAENAAKRSIVLRPVVTPSAQTKAKCGVIPRLKPAARASKVAVRTAA